MKRFFKGILKTTFIIATILSLTSQAFAITSAAIYEPAKAPKIRSFTSSSAAASSGETVILSWDVVNATMIEIIGLDKETDEVLPLKGSLEVWPMETTTYTLIATSSGGTAKASVIVEVGVVTNVSIDSFTASSTKIVLGNTIELSWTTTNAQSISIIGLEKQEEEDGALPFSGSLEVFPTATTTYLLIAVGFNNDITYKELTVTVEPKQDISSPLLMDLSIHDWGDEYIINFDITNQSSKPVMDWTLTFKKSEFDLKIIWGATFTETDEYVIISPLGYNSTIKPDYTVSYGFQAYGSPVPDFYYEFDYK